MLRKDVHAVTFYFVNLYNLVYMQEGKGVHVLVKRVVPAAVW